MTKRSLRQQEVVSYALLRGKLVPRDEVLKQGLGLKDNNNLGDSQAVSFEKMSAKQLKELLDQQGIEYNANASKAELIELLDHQDDSDLEIK